MTTLISVSTWNYFHVVKLTILSQKQKILYCVVQISNRQMKSPKIGHFNHFSPNFDGLHQHHLNLKPNKLCSQQKFKRFPTKRSINHYSSPKGNNFVGG